MKLPTIHMAYLKLGISLLKVNNKKHPNENVDCYEISIKPTTDIVQNYFDDLPQFFKSRENIGDDP